MLVSKFYSTQKPLQFPVAYRYPFFCFRYPAESSPIQFLLPDTESISIPIENLDMLSGPTTKEKECLR